MSSLTTRRPLKLLSAHVHFNGNGLGFSMKILDRRNSQLLMLMYGCVFCLYHLPFDVGFFFKSKHVRLDLPLFAVIASHRIVRDTFTLALYSIHLGSASVYATMTISNVNYLFMNLFLCAALYSDYHTAHALGFLKKTIFDVPISVRLEENSTSMNKYSFGVNTISSLNFFKKFFIDKFRFANQEAPETLFHLMNHRQWWSRCKLYIANT